MRSIDGGTVCCCVSVLFLCMPLNAEQLFVQPRLTAGESYSSFTANELDLDQGIIGEVEFGNVILLQREIASDHVEPTLIFGGQAGPPVARFIDAWYADLDFDGEGEVVGVAVGLYTRNMQLGPLAGGSDAWPQKIFDGRPAFNGADAILHGDVEIDVDGDEDNCNRDAIGFNAGLSWALGTSDGHDVAPTRFMTPGGRVANCWRDRLAGSVGAHAVSDDKEVAAY